MTETAKRAAIYARVSTDEQANKFSLDSQVSECQKHIEENGYALVEKPFREDYTGTVMDRPELDKLRELAQERQIDVIICLELDRLGRGLVVPLVIESEFKKFGVKVEYVQEEYEDTPEGALKKGMRATISEYERLKTLERTKRGRNFKAKSGNVMATPLTKYGFEKVKEDGKTLYSPVDDEAAVILSIFTLFARGDETGMRLTRFQIARRLTSMGILTRRDKAGGKLATLKKARPGHWSHHVILNILRDEIYAGMTYAGRHRMVEKDGKKRQVLQPRSAWIPIKVPAIVPRELWQAAQDRLDANKHDPAANSRNNKRSVFLMRSRLRCARCGKTLCFDSRSLEYRCQGANRSHMYTDKAICHGTYSQPKIDAQIWRVFSDFLQDPEKIRASYERDQSDTQAANSPIKSRLEVVTGLLDHRTTERNALLDDHLKKLFPPDVLASRATPLNAEIAALEHQKAGLEAQIRTPRIDETSYTGLLAFSDQVREGLPYLTDEEKRDMITMFDIHGLVMREGREYCIELVGLPPQTLTVRGQVREPSLSPYSARIGRSG